MSGCSSAPSFTNLLSSSSASRRLPSETQTGVFRFIGCAAGDLACRLVCVPTNLLVCSLPPSLTHSSQIELESLIEGRSNLTDEGNLRTVGIKIQLRKECKYGEQFFIVGAQPNLGLWNPLDAVPMTWSDDHLWTAELDIPIGEPVQFKFILREISGKFLWQPGKDRVLHTWETCNIISVIEDWEDVEAQQVNEEQVVNRCEESDLMETEIKQLKHSDEKCNDENTLVDKDVTLQPAKNEDSKSELGLVEEGQIKEEEQVIVELDSSKIVNVIEAETTIEEQVKRYRELETVNGRSSTFSAEHPDLKVGNNEDAYCHGDQDLESAFSERPIIRGSDPWRDEIKWGQTALKRFLNNLGFL